MSTSVEQAITKGHINTVLLIIDLLLPMLSPWKQRKRPEVLDDRCFPPLRRLQTVP
jgi:hypothetical protein